ncbi:MAG: gfo/Idh/MocA family oxidoreductase [Chloroflexi bacterium]|nr:MAG: gfo/Idh/MocA family oxidoreductase [Chloroflexota bacterium]
MSVTPKARLAVIGVGVMGSSHVRDIANRLENTELVAICDIDRERADQYAAEYNVPAYYDHRELLAKAELDGIVIATPHYDHTTISIAAMERGIHVLTEKPLAVHVKDGRKMIAAYHKAREQKPDIVFAIMFQNRTHGYWQKVKEMVDTGKLGKLVRATWLLTDWFRTQRYYDSGGWRATWRGEGGGVLLNQCPHNLDMYQWIFGLPSRVAGYAHIGKYHNIEVEDEVTGYFEHANGMVGHFITTTAESPGTNRLEIAGEMGKLVCENNKISFYRNEVSMFDFLRTSEQSFATVPYAVEDIPFLPSADWGHWIVLEAFANAILNGGKPVAEAPEGLNGLMLGNAMMLSSFQGCPVDLPIDEDAYEAKLMELIKTSRFQKTVQSAEIDLDKSFHK